MEALNFQLTVIVGLVLGAVLLLFFVGLLVLIGVVFIEIVASLTAGVEHPKRPPGDPAPLAHPLREVAVRRSRGTAV